MIQPMAGKDKNGLLTTTYGRWLVSRHRTCETNANCYDVRFVPNTTEIANITNIATLELTTTITESGQSTPIETDTLTLKITPSFPTREISIEASTITINEAETATITLIADGDPLNDNLMVKYTPTETGSSFLKDDDMGNGTEDSRTAMLEFLFNSTTDKWEAEIEIATNIVDGKDTENGVITVVLDTPESDDGYTIGMNPNDRVND